MKVHQNFLVVSSMFTWLHFLLLLAGFFHPLITNTSFDIVVVGVLVLFVGLAGGFIVVQSCNI